MTKKMRKMTTTTTTPAPATTSPRSALNMRSTKPNSLCRYIVDHLAHHGAPDLASTAKYIETWTAVLQNEDLLLTYLGKMSGPSAPHPVLFLALDAATSTVIILHHFGIASSSDHQRGGPHFAALCMDRVDQDTPPQVVYATATDLCRRVTFIDNLAEGETLVSPSRTKKSSVTSAVLLPIPLQWAPLFLTEEEPIYTKDAFVGLSKLASSIHRHKTAYATVMTFAWGLITRRTPKSPKPTVAVALTMPRLDRALTNWRNERLQGIFKSPPSSTAFVDLTSVLSTSSKRAATVQPSFSTPPRTSPVGRERAGHVDRDSPAITGASTPVGRDRSARPVAKDRAELVRKPAPTENRDLRTTCGITSPSPWLTQRSWSPPLPSCLPASKHFSSYCIGLTTST
jgi:hypothetical protein